MGLEGVVIVIVIIVVIIAIIAITIVICIVAIWSAQAGCTTLPNLVGPWGRFGNVTECPLRWVVHVPSRVR